MLDMIANEVYKFSHAPTTLMLLTAIIGDVIMGIVAALRIGRFELQKIAMFYRTSVLPYLIGYCGLYVLIGLRLSEYSPSGMIEVVQQFTSAPAILALMGSITDNAKRASLPPIPPHENDGSALSIIPSTLKGVSNDNSTSASG